ncbi:MULTISPECIES: NADP-dependent oxidoreductase [unclassified Aeromicrobium]|uniref:NADP-dependent oxidoreductase n=1 Tax=unclassified Aeromicrobium TaxID=2633570 RepID=UPI00396B2E76
MGVSSSRAVVLSRRPSAVDDLECFDLVDRPVRALADGEVLVRVTTISVDPSMIPRLVTATYAPAFEIGAPIESRAVGVVMESRSERIPAGATVLHWGGWQEFAVVHESTVDMLEVTDDLTADLWLHVLGAPGLTAYVGIDSVARVQPGDVVWVSAVTGAVGSVAAQLARARGASVIGSAGGAEKVDHATSILGVEHCLDYREGDLVEQLRRVAPDGIDVYFDNVGGTHLETALQVLRVGGRIVACGMISSYGQRDVRGVRHLDKVISSRLTIGGFLVADHLDKRPDFHAEARRMLGDGTLRYDIARFEGLSAAPSALASLRQGNKLGKVLVYL